MNYETIVTLAGGIVIGSSTTLAAFRWAVRVAERRYAAQRRPEPPAGEQAAQPAGTEQTLDAMLTRLDQRHAELTQALDARIKAETNRTE